MKDKFWTCDWCADSISIGEWTCPYCQGTKRVKLLTALNQAFGFGWRWWALTKVSYRLFGKCRQGGCWNRPQWYHAQAGTHSHLRGLACDLHVTRGCCWPNGTTICADYAALPFFSGDEGEADPNKKENSRRDL